MPNSSTTTRNAGVAAELGLNQFFGKVEGGMVYPIKDPMPHGSRTREVGSILQESYRGMQEPFSTQHGYESATSTETVQ